MTRLKKLIFNIFCYSIFLFCMCICMCTYISSTWCSSICCLSLIDDVIGGNDDDDRSFNEFISRSSSSAIFVFQWERSRRREIDRNKRNTLNVLLCGLIEKEKSFFSFSFFSITIKIRGNKLQCSCIFIISLSPLHILSSSLISKDRHPMKPLQNCTLLIHQLDEFELNIHTHTVSFSKD